MNDDRQRLLDLLERLGTLLRTERRRISAQNGLSEVHLAILDYLSRCNRFSNTPQAVSAWLGITKGTISQSIKLLESRGLLKKQPDAEDRRVVRLGLTRRGRTLARSGMDGAWHAVLRALPEEEVLSLVRGLERLLMGLQERHGYRTFQQCRTCRHLQTTAEGLRCGLTQQPLTDDDLRKICMEHEAPSRRAVNQG